jgi:DNA-binding NarL/FixJ family response regulator
MRVIRVAVADDDPLFREALVEVIRSDVRFALVGTASDGEEIVRIARDVVPDLVVLDVHMPGGGVEAAEAIRDAFERAEGPVVVAVSAQTGASAVLAMLRAGAVGYLAKGKLGAYLPDILERCASGHVVLAAPGGAEALRQLAGR